MQPNETMRVAQQVVEQCLGTECFFEDGLLLFSIYAVETDDVYQGAVEHYPKRDALVVGAAPDWVLTPWRGCRGYFKELAQTLEIFLEGRYGPEGFLELCARRGVMQPAYEVPLIYSTLDDEELLEALGQALVRSLRAMSLLQPFFALLRKEGPPSREAVLGLLEQAHNYWELKSFGTAPEDKLVHLPHRLYGGVGMLKPQ